MTPREREVEGLRELEVAFKTYGDGLEKGVREVLATAAEPVRFEAEVLAVASIRSIGIPWSRMRVGVTRTTAYVAPGQRGRHTSVNRRRPNLKNLLLDRAMEPALAANVDRVEVEVVDALDDLAKAWARV
jgi:hypothetical protein